MLTMMKTLILVASMLVVLTTMAMDIPYRTIRKEGMTVCYRQISVCDFEVVNHRRETNVIGWAEFNRYRKALVEYGWECSHPDILKMVYYYASPGPSNEELAARQAAATEWCARVMAEGRAAQAERNTWFYNRALSTSSSQNWNNNSRMVHVNGYYRDNGTYVSSYWRHYPDEQ